MGCKTPAITPACSLIFKARCSKDCREVAKKESCSEEQDISVRTSRVSAARDRRPRRSLGRVFGPCLVPLMNVGQRIDCSALPSGLVRTLKKLWPSHHLFISAESRQVSERPILCHHKEFHLQRIVEQAHCWLILSSLLMPLRGNTGCSSRLANPVCRIALGLCMPLSGLPLLTFCQSCWW